MTRLKLYNYYYDIATVAILHFVRDGSEGSKSVYIPIETPCMYNIYIHHCHPSHCKKSITYSQAIRLRWICSEEDDFTKRTVDLKNHLIQRGYKQEEIHESIQKVSGKRRDETPNNH